KATAKCNPDSHSSSAMFTIERLVRPMVMAFPMGTSSLRPLAGPSIISKCSGMQRRSAAAQTGAHGGESGAASDHTHKDGGAAHQDRVGRANADEHVGLARLGKSADQNSE